MLIFFIKVLIHDSKFPTPNPPDMGSGIHRYLDARDYRRRQKKEKQAIMAEMKVLRRKYKMARKREFRDRFTGFFSNPFAGRQLTQEQLDIQQIKRQWQRERREARSKWLFSFLKNPYRTLFPKNEIPQDMVYIIRQSKIDRKTTARVSRKEILENLKKLLAIAGIRKKVINIFFLSTSYYILSFLLIYIICQAVTIIVATNFEIPVEWYYYRVRFPLSRDSYLYTRSALVAIFGSGPMASLLLTLLFLKLFFSNSPTSKNLQLFYLWGIINGLNMFFGAYIVGILTRTDFVYSTEWLLMNHPYDFRELIFTAVSFSVMLLAGWLITPMFLVSSGSLTLVSSENRLFLIFFQAILPWIAGGILFFLINIPKFYIPFLLKTITPGLILIASLFTYNSVRNNTILEMGMIRRTNFQWGIVIVAVILLFLYRIVLNSGFRLDH
jgi:hypothetical protein